MSSLVLLVALSWQSALSPPYPATITVQVNGAPVVMLKVLDHTDGRFGAAIESWNDSDGVRHFSPMVNYRGYTASGHRVFWSMREHPVDEQNAALITVVSGIE